MLSEAKNKLLTQVGPGTPMGDYLRRYWFPIAGSAEFDDMSVKAIRLMGEDLTLYKDLSGTYGLVDRHCPHRRADMSYGYVEKNGLRCNYHGWLMDETGACVEQPYEDTANPNNKLKERCGSKAYPVRELSGLLWAYMGPAPAPELPVYEAFTFPNGFVEVVTSDIPCNWFQCQENSIDPVHFEWMHDNWSIRQKGSLGPYASTHLKVAFDEFDKGFTYRRVRSDSDESSAMWTVGRVFLWPLGFYLGEHFEWRVPVDDENTLSIGWFYARVPKEAEPYRQKHIPHWRGPIRQPDGRWISSHVINQDIIAWVGQGAIADRSKENLGASDRGIALIRNRFFDELEAVAAGRDPKGLIRDPEEAKLVQLPIAERRNFLEGKPLAEFFKHPYYSKRLKDFPWHFGQPEAVRKAFCEAMGVDLNGAPLARASEPAE
ncbi:MAG: phthalate 4,5-dioxygenase [Hyphomicrobiales bacterium]|nr:phthalate 4,5-dioxygenase [Hyphomicrobiales bacterium]